MYLVQKKNNNSFSGLTKDSFLLAFASFFADISTEMLYPVLPIYLTQILKEGGSVVGIIEGVAEATQNIIQGVSGWISDKIQKRKPIALIGYALAALSKPLIGLSSIWQAVLGARFLDRLGTGTRSAPRDALIASSVAEEHRGKAFGIEGLGDNLGAFLGPIIAILIIFTFGIGIRHIFYLAFIPGLLAFLMIFFVKEGKKVSASKSKLDVNFKKFPKSYWKYLAAIAVFGIGNSSNSFLILQTKTIEGSVELTIFIYAIFNLVAALISYPSGSLSDKLGRKKILLFAMLIFFTSYLGFALSRNIFIIGFFFILYGLYQGIFRTVGKAYSTDFVSSQIRASAVGWYSATIGLTGLFASIIAGQLWDKVGHWAVFAYGAIFSLLGMMTLLLLVPSKTTLNN